MIQLKSAALDRLKSLKAAGIPFTITSTGQSCSIKTDYIKIHYSDSEIPLSELHFIQQVKKYIVDNNIQARKEFCKYEKVDFLMFNKPPIDHISHDVAEIDLTAAYWAAMFDLEYISPELYAKGLKMNKITRLAAIGSLASKKNVRYFNGSTTENREQIFNRDHFNIWFSVVLYTDLRIKQALTTIGENWYFYWVDAIFLPKAEARRLEQYFDLWDIQYKTKELKAIQFTENNYYVRTAAGELKKYPKPKFAKQYKNFFIKYFIND